ncbi:hypothetical protein AJ88_39305 [Mesorhizobium amorphae CCBAU 01583]|nr:hypothetical protein AJ88_39305 [Mesorhizobium amorphae CCBAU 01583]
MNRLKTYLAAASAMACLVAPAIAAGPEGSNGKSLNGLKHNSLTSNSLTSNSLTSNAIFTHGLGVHALNGVQADGIVLAKSLAPAGGSVIDPNDPICRLSSTAPAPQPEHGQFAGCPEGQCPTRDRRQEKRWSPVQPARHRRRHRGRT